MAQVPDFSKWEPINADYYVFNPIEKRLVLEYGAEYDSNPYALTVLGKIMGVQLEYGKPAAQPGIYTSFGADVYFYDKLVLKCWDVIPGTNCFFGKVAVKKKFGRWTWWRVFRAVKSTYTIFFNCIFENPDKSGGEPVGVSINIFKDKGQLIHNFIVRPNED